MTRPKPRRVSRYVLRLYVTGATARSARAIENLRRICGRYLENRCEVEIVDLYKNLPLARDDQVVASPTLIRRWPQPVRRLIGDLSDEKRVLAGLGLEAR